MSTRVWDRFLTEQDQRQLATRRAYHGKMEDRKIRFGERPALLLIDLYRWVFGDRPEPIEESVKLWPTSCGLAGWNALPHIQGLLAASRAAGIPVIHSTGMVEENVSNWARGARIGEPTDAEELERYQRRYDIVDEVAPVSGELIIRKLSPSVFWGTALVGHLVDRGVDTILVGGETTSGCVRASVVDGCTYRFKMIVAEECVFDRHEACHAINLFDMNQKYADVIPLREVLELLSSWQVPMKAERGLGQAPEARYH